MGLTAHHTELISPQNKPNGQYHLPHNREAILDFMGSLSVRKVPGVGRINERLLDAIGVKVRAFDVPFGSRSYSTLPDVW